MPPYGFCFIYIVKRLSALNDSLSLLGNKKLNAIAQNIPLSEKDCNTCKNGSYWHGYGQNYDVTQTHLPLNTNGFLISIGIVERANAGYTIQFFQPYPNPEKLYMRTMIFSWSEWKVITFS